MLTSANSLIDRDNDDALSIDDIPFDELEAEEDLGLRSDKENIPPGRKKDDKPKKKHQPSKKELKEAHRQGELLKRTAQVAPPTSEITAASSNGNLKSFLSNYYKKETPKNKENSNNIKGKGIKETIAYLSKKPWAKLLNKNELDRIANQKPNLSFDSDKSYSNPDPSQPIVVIKTEQCGRSDATKRIIKQGIVSQKPVKNSIDQLNRTLQAKIEEQSTQSWRLRKESFRRKNKNDSKKEKQLTNEDEYQLTEEEEETKIEHPQDDLLKDLCFDTREEKKQEEMEELPKDLLLDLYSKKTQGNKDNGSSSGEEKISEGGENEKDNETQLDDLIEEALREEEPSKEEIMDEEARLLETKQKQQKSIMGFLNGGNNAELDLPLFVDQKVEEPVPLEKNQQKVKRKNDRGFKYKNYFLDEEAQLSEDGQEESKKKRTKILDSDDIVDEAEIERET